MRATALCTLLILATGLPVIAQDGDGLEGPMGHPDFVARWNHFGGNMGVTGSHGPGTPGYHYIKQTSSAGRAFYRYLGASIPSQRLGPSWWRFKAKNAHHFEIRSPEGEPIVGARFVLSLPRQGKVFALEQKSDHNGALGIRLLKPRKAHDVFIVAEGYSPVRYTMAGGKLKSEKHTIQLEPTVQGPVRLVDLQQRLVQLHYRPAP